MTAIPQLNRRQRFCIIGSSLLALFLGALDALIMSAAMPSIVSDLGGLHLYAWVYSAYFLSRAVSLPVFGKLADLYGVKSLFLFSITLFLLASAAAGFSQSMAFLVACRVIQGIGAGGNFALVYIVLSNVEKAEQRAKTLSLASSVWGLSSILGPTLGGIIVSYWSWRWIFFLNIPLGIVCLCGIGLYLREFREQEERVQLDLLGLGLFSTTVLGVLVIFIAGGRELNWVSMEMAMLAAVTFFLGFCFYRVEKRVAEPMIDVGFFRNRTFALSNGATFFASVTIFSLFAYVPLYLQGGRGLNPMQVGMILVSLSLGWSCGSLFLGRCVAGGGGRKSAVSGGALLLAGSLVTLGFDLGTSAIICFATFFLIGIGMGCVTLSTLILVQNSASADNLGVVTSLHQFGRSLGGTVGVGVCGGLVTNTLLTNLNDALLTLPPEFLSLLAGGTEYILQPDFQKQVPSQAVEPLREAVLSGVSTVFLVAVVASALSLCCSLLLPGTRQPAETDDSPGDT